MMTRRAILALIMLLAIVGAACASDSGEDTTSEEGAEEPAAEEEAEEPAEEEPAEEEAEEPAEEAEEPAEEEPAEEDGTGDLAASDGESLVIWADERKIEPLETVAPAFTEATGVNVIVELVAFDQIRDAVNLSAPAGEGPDIFVGAHDWTGELAANGVIAPIDLGDRADSFVEVAVNAFGFEGQTYAVPYVTEAIALYYNTDLVPEPPTTFDELGAACEAAGTESCVGIPGGGADPDAYHNYPFVSAYGASIFAYDPATGSYDPSEVLLDSDAALQGVADLEQYVADGIVASTNYDAAKNLFLNGDAPFWITGPWELGALRDSDINFDVAVIPQIGDQPTAPFVGAQGFFLSAFSENSLLAQTFMLDFIATDEVMQALYDADPRGTAWQSVQDSLADDPQVQTFAEAAGNGIPMPNVPEMAAVWGPLGDNLLLLRNGELGSQEAMTTSAEAVRDAVSG